MGKEILLALEVAAGIVVLLAISVVFMIGDIRKAHRRDPSLRKEKPKPPQYDLPALADEVKRDCPPGRG